MDTAEIQIVGAHVVEDSTLIGSRALLGVVARSLSEALEVVSLPQFRVLVILSSSGPLRMGALAARAHTVPSTFSRSVDRMVMGGWVVRRESPDSRREVLIELSRAGHRLVEDVTKRRFDEISAILARLSPPDRACVAAAFALFSEAAGEPQPEDLLTLGL
jgi:DNA-binding MarR family transcriptional regulator